MDTPGSSNLDGVGKLPTATSVQMGTAVFPRTTSAGGGATMGPGRATTGSHTAHDGTATNSGTTASRAAARAKGAGGPPVPP